MAAPPAAHVALAPRAAPFRPIASEARGHRSHRCVARASPMRPRTGVH